MKARNSKNRRNLAESPACNPGSPSPERRFEREKRGRCLRPPRYPPFQLRAEQWPKCNQAVAPATGFPLTGSRTARKAVSYNQESANRCLKRSKIVADFITNPPHLGDRRQPEAYGWMSE